MFAQLKNFIEKENIWKSKRVNFVNFKDYQEVEFIREKTDYVIKIEYFTEKNKLKKEKKKVNKEIFYNQLLNIVENTIFNPGNYKLNQYNKYDTMLTLWFNMD